MSEPDHRPKPTNPVGVPNPSASAPPPPPSDLQFLPTEPVPEAAPETTADEAHEPERADSMVISAIAPAIDGGRFALKRLIWEDLHVEADIFRDGHDVLTAVLKWRRADAADWQETPMVHQMNDRWRGHCCFFEPGRHEFVIEGWAELFLTWSRDLEKKLDAGQDDLRTEILEGSLLLKDAARRAADSGETDDAAALLEESESLRESASPRDAFDRSQTPAVRSLMEAWSDRSLSTTGPPIPVEVDRERGGFSAWYEFFPRSAEGHADRGSTFRDCLPRLDDARAMGFDVIYFPPIHPIGVTARKGPNNTLVPGPNDPGSPWAIGAAEGGHRSVHPDLGTIDDFVWLIGEARSRGMEIAIDFAINCSPDHPYVKDHPEWFFHRPDGTIKYAENPPKKYQDIYPLNFHCEGWRALWKEMVDVVLFWVDKGVKIFRVDNPHTKPVAFWEYLIEEVRAVAPDTLFLAEAFTRPKMMQALGKIGFTQSYTYFTWRRSKHDFIEYLTELTQTEMAEYYRANFWPNTPDILSDPLRNAPPAAFKMRAALAALLTPSWGLYSGFEFCENQPASEENEEYYESEKFQFKARDWNNPDNIKEFIGALNRIRQENPALRLYRNPVFCHTGNDQILAWARATPDAANIILTVVNLDPYHRHDSDIEVPLERLGLSEGVTLHVEDLLNGGSYEWEGRHNFVSLDPADKVAHVFKIEV